jgi:signal transduction histidine kinase
MARRGHRRQILLFLIAVLFPCLVLIGLGLRITDQEQELAGKRAADERRRRVEETRELLSAKLQRIAILEVDAWLRRESGETKAPRSSAEVALVGRVRQDRLELPWERALSQATSRWVVAPRIELTIREGERSELVEGQPERAIEGYREALKEARNPAAAYVRLLLARALEKTGKKGEALSHYRTLLGFPSEITDEQGMPFSLYAARRLAQEESFFNPVRARIEAELGSGRWLAPTEAYLLRDALEEMSSRGVDAAPLKVALTRYLETLEQALALQKDFAGLRLVPRVASTASTEPLWIPYGKLLWLVSLTPLPGGAGPLVIAVDAEAVMPRSGSPLRIFTGEAEGEFLGESFPGLKVTFATDGEVDFTRASRVHRQLYIAGLVLVLLLTFFVAYLLWRDLKRELQLSEMRSHFVSSVSHELKTPLTSIRMFAETLRLGRFTDGKKQDEYLETIVEESERLTRLLDSVLDFSQIERGRRTYRLRKASIADVVRATVRAVEYPLKREGFDLRVKIEDDASALLDADAVEQALLNLVVNAMKYSGESREIDLRLSSQDGQARIEVRDRGLGIPREEQARIFESFYRVETEENRRIPGAGLGLALVEHVAKGHGGRVLVESAPGRGSTFTLELPLECET